MSFRTRAAAEQVSLSHLNQRVCLALGAVRLLFDANFVLFAQGFTKGSHIALVGPVQVSWFTGPAGGTLTQTPSAAPASSAMDTRKEAPATDSAAPTDDVDSHMHHEEPEPETGGWGADDDGFGMM